MDKSRKIILRIVGVIIVILILTFFTNKKVIYRYMPNSKVNETVKNMKDSSKERLGKDDNAGDDDLAIADEASSTQENTENSYDQKYDYDLTANDADMNYVIVAMIAEDPKSFEGVKIKLSGIAMDMQTTDTSGIDHYVVINDRQACCQQGLQYVLEEKDAKYPKDKEEITVEGELTVFNSDEIPFPLPVIAKAKIVSHK